MKIAFINIYSGLVARGAETFVLELANRLAKNHQVTVFQAGERGEDVLYKVVQIPCNIDWTKKDYTGTLLRKLFVDYWSLKIFLFTLQTLPMLIKNKYDIVVPLNGGWMSAIVRITTWLYGGKMVISGQSGLGWDDRNNLWSLPNVFIALTAFAKKWANSANPFVRVETIPNGVDTTKFQENGPIYKTALKKPIVLCVAALIDSKRVNLVIDAVAKLRKVSLLIVGKGARESVLIKQGKKLLGSRFELVNLSFDKMPAVYRSADVFTIVSENYYAFEIVIVEAMATNLPVVVNKDNIRREIIGEVGLMTDPTNSADYAKALESALKTAWGSKPRDRALSFDWNRIATRYEKLFLDLVKK